MHVGLLIYGSLDTISGGFIYDRNLVRYLREAGDRVDVINLPWRHYGVSLLDNLNSGLRRRLRQAAFDVLLEDELVHPSCFWLNQRLRYRLTYPMVAIVHHLRCREQHPAFMTRLYRRVEKSYLASVDGFVCVSRTTQADVEDVVGRARPLMVASPGRDGLPGAVSRRGDHGPGHRTGAFSAYLCGQPDSPQGTAHAAGGPGESSPGRLAADGGRQPGDGCGLCWGHPPPDKGRGPGLPGCPCWGPCPARELAARCAASHLLAVPSSYEGFGIVYLEGMHFGLPAIAGTAGAAKEIIRHGHNGFLVPPGDAAALAHAINLLMEDRELLKRMSLTAHRSAGGPSHLERERRAGAGLPPEFPVVTMSGPAAPDFIRYLAAKKGLDDRSLNRQVWDAPGAGGAGPAGLRPPPGPGSGLRHRHHAGAAAGLGFADPGGVHRHRCGGRSSSGRPPSACAVMRRRARPTSPWSPTGPCSSRPPPRKSG